MLYVVAVIALLSLVVFAYRGCTKKQIKLDEKAIAEAQQAIAENDRKKMVDVLAKSDAEEAVADGIIANSKSETINKIAESKDKWSAASDEDVRKELEARAR